MKKAIIVGLIVVGVVALIVWVVNSTGPRYPPKHPNGTPTPSQSNQ